MCVVRWFGLIAVFAVPLLAGRESRAGVYCPIDLSYEVLSADDTVDYRVFDKTYAWFKYIRNAQVSPLWPKAFLMNDMASALNPEEMSETSLLYVSAYLIRWGEGDPIEGVDPDPKKRLFQAIDLLKPGTTKFPDNPLLRSNMATAYFLAAGGSDVDLMNAAHVNITLALNSWPADIKNLKPHQAKYFEDIWRDPRNPNVKKYYDFYRLADTYFQRLVQDRIKDAKAMNAEKSTAKKRKLEREQSVDALFVDKTGKPLRFVDKDGGYKAKLKLPEAELDKLPNHDLKMAVYVVEQLLVWMPWDERLYWQLAELLNAAGFPGDALQIFNNIAPRDITLNKQSPYDEFKEHHRVLEEYAKANKNVEIPSDGGAPNGPKQKSAPDTTADDTNSAENLADRWRFFGVGAFCGAVCALFAAWQIRRRPGGRRSATPVASSPPPQSTGISKLD